MRVPFRYFAVFLFAFASPVFAMEWLEQLSVAAERLWPGGRRCQAYDATHALSMLDPNCPAPGPLSPKAVVNTAKVAKSLSDQAEDKLFARLASQQAQENICARDFTLGLVNNTQGSSDIVRENVQQLRQAEQDLQAQTSALNTRGIELHTDFIAYCVNLPPGAPTKIDDCKGYIAARNRRDLIRSTIPYNDHKAVAKILDHYTKTPSSAEADRLLKSLDASLRTAYSSVASDLDSAAAYLQDKVDKGETFNRWARYALLSDPALIAKVEDHDKDVQQVACWADARYHDGADHLAVEASIGSLAGSGILSLIGRAAWGAGVAGQALTGARALQVISFTGYRTLQMAMLFLNNTLAIDGAIKACKAPKRATAKAAKCASAPTVETMKNDQCYLLVALSVLGEGVKGWVYVNGIVNASKRVAPSAIANETRAVTNSLATAVATSGAGSPIASDTLNEVQNILRSENAVVEAPQYATRILMHTDAAGNPIKTKETIVLIHGLFLSPKAMAVQEQEAFKAGYNVINLRLPGHYERVREALDTATADQWTKATEGALNLALKMGDKVSLVGHSTGGLLAAQMAVEHPEDVKSLFLISPALKVQTGMVNEAQLSKVGISGWLLENGKAPAPGARYESTYAGVQVSKMATALSKLGGHESVDGGYHELIDRLAGLNVTIVDTAKDGTIDAAQNAWIADRVQEAASAGGQMQHLIVPAGYDLSHAAMTVSVDSDGYKAVTGPAFERFLQDNK